MKRKTLTRILFFLLLTLFFVQQIIFLPGCANVVPPQGGPRDSLPPVLLKVTPPDSSLHFKEKTITFQFDEYIDPQAFQQNYFKELLISPVPERTPTAEARLKTVTIKFKDTLDPNTTYSIDFGKSIQDVNERNVLKDFLYIFSTGDAFDSLTFSGNVILAETGKVDTTLIVMLHTKSEDSALINNKPRYVTKLDNKGNFRFRFLPPGTYYVYALKDESGSYKYFGSEMLFAFADKPVQVSDTTAAVTLYAYASKKKEEPVPSAPTSDRNNRDNRLKFSTTASSNMQDMLEDFAFLFDVPLKNFDASKMAVSTDTTYTPARNYSWELDSSSTRLALKTTLKEDTRYNVILDKDFATDSLGLQLLKPDTVNFQTRKLSEYGSVRLIFKNLDLAKNPVIQFVQNDKVIKAYPLTETTFYQQLFLPGTYNLRVLYDDNKNGIWDPGEFFEKHKQPEIVVPLKDQLIIKAGWDNEKDITIE